KTGNVNVKMETNYPWEGNVKMMIDPVKKAKFKLYVRLPGWYFNKIVPGDLYRTGGDDGVPDHFSFLLNGKAVTDKYENGYAVIETEWKKGDVLELNFPMEVKQLMARDELKQDSNRIAIQRGPIVYCVEGADNNGKAWNIIVPENTVFETIDYKVQDEHIKALTAEVPVITVGDDGVSLQTEKKKITAIPYYTWANRGRNEMQVWLSTKVTDVKINY
ncbi:MAG TPA: glycoside hydrolase family 127 protein, partial [Chitinophagaceae bacterium]|nr:glycoside hydrolase family 127 protein [Chitinophagaceae bacterium]